MIADDYTALAVLTIAAEDNEDLSFSADTGMAECLVIARKLKQGESPHTRAHFTSLQSRPQGFAHASSIAGSILADSQIRRIEDGPYGGAILKVGEEPTGETITATYGGDNWRAVRLSDCSVAQTSHALSQSSLWLPGSHSSLEVKVAVLSDVGKRGWHDMNLAGSSGPFTKMPPSPTSTYPALWSHNARGKHSWSVRRILS